jgi:hypothetical protein
MTVPPKLGAKSFSCLDCGAHADQHWYELAASILTKAQSPSPLEDADIARFFRFPIDPSDRRIIDSLGERALREPFFVTSISNSELRTSVQNLHLSQCYSCSRLTVWIGNRPVWPATERTHSPNADLPHDVAADFREADEIHRASPRGAAALLRLAIQKLCRELTKERDLNAAIAALVREGMPIAVQKALDVVRVIGNNAVHPGELDLQDDTATVEALFSLVNMIGDYAITKKRQLDTLYGSLPAGALASIERRDSSG